MDTHKNPIQTKYQVVRCDGGEGALGHPAVFLNLGEEGETVCPYCSQVFVKNSLKKTQGHA